MPCRRAPTTRLRRQAQHTAQPEKSPPVRVELVDCEAPLGYGVGCSGLATSTWLAGGGVTFTVTPKSYSSRVVSMVIWVAVAPASLGTLRVTAYWILRRRPCSSIQT